jgi:endo-alpha-1,4-polygalactosaminidase (GH114 family)
MKKVFALFLLLPLMVQPCFGWQFVDADTVPELNRSIVILDPDSCNRADLGTFKEMGLKTVAWLNVAEIESWRLIAVDVKAKDYVVPNRFSRQGLPLARFYSTEFKTIVKSRVREYMLKGFSGIFLAGTDKFAEISNNPINRSEMWRLIEELASLASSLAYDPIILVQGSDFVERIKSSELVDGVIISGLFNAEKGRHVHPWQRNDRLDRLKCLFETGKLLLTVEMAERSQQQEFIERECKKLNIDFCFHQIPLKMKEIEYGSKR